MLKFDFLYKISCENRNVYLFVMAFLKKKNKIYNDISLVPDSYVDFTRLRS